MQQQARAQDFMQLNGYRAGALIAGQWLFVAATIALSVMADHVLAYLAAVWLIGSRMVSLAEVIGHEAVHNNLFQRRELNRQLEIFWFLPIFESYDSYKADHDKHHAFLLTEKDPTYRDYERWGLHAEKPNFFWIWFVRPFFFFDTLYMLQVTLSGLWHDAGYRKRMLIFWVPAAAVIFATGTAELFFYYWMVPWLWAYPALIFWSEVGEHYKTPVGKTRNTFGFAEWLLISPHNDRFHAVHHRYPRIPWFNLEKSHAALTEEQLGPVSESRSFLGLYRQIAA